MIEKYGYWQVDNQKYLNKFDALYRASKNNQKVQFHYHDEIWNNFDRSILGKIPLKSLYHERAQQLRDKYDYLILYYSGGSDSHNVLISFLENNITLDEVCIKWPKSLQDGKFYTPNTKDTSAKNYWSEWDFSIKPILEWLSNKYPKIKITFRDYTESLGNYDIEPLFDSLNFVRGGAMLFNSVVSDSEPELLLQNKTVGHIYGIDKPLLSYDEQTRQVYMYFSDNALDQAGVSTINPTGAECFYWSPDFPLLSFEQAYQLAMYYEHNKHHRKYMWDAKLPATSEEKIIKNQFQADLGRIVLYDNWDNKFQTDKPKVDIRTDKFFWFFETSELSDVRDTYIGHLRERLGMLSSNVLTSENDKSISELSLNELPVYKVTPSPKHWVCKLTN